MATGTPDDKRQASSLTISLSSYVMAASFVALGVQALVVTFVVDSRTQLGAFYAVSAIGTLSLIASVVCGWIGLRVLTRAAAEGDWRIRTDAELFTWQTLFALAGAVSVVVSAFLGERSPSPGDRRTSI